VLKLAFGSFNNICIRGITCALPNQIKNPKDYYERFGQDTVDNIIKMIGVEQKYIAHPYQTASDLAYIAAKDLMENLGWKPDTVDVLIVVTQTPDYIIPSTACILQHRLGLSEECIAYDINLGCTAYTYGLFTVMNMLQNSNFKRGLLLVGDTLNQILNPNDINTVLVISDGASATALEKTEQICDIKYMFRTYGECYDSVIVKNSGFRNRNKEVLLEEDSYFFMNGMQLLKFTISEVADSINEFKSKIGVTSEDIDYFILHQANTLMTKNLAKKIKAPWEKIPITITKYGNVGGASLALDFVDSFLNSKEYINKKFILSSFGTGLSFGSIYLNIDYEIYLNIKYTDYYQNVEEEEK
jgi:3-oxoacyl-[acyl-carrier-protein] synthase-3